MFAWCLVDVLRTFYYCKGDIRLYRSPMLEMLIISNTAMPIVAPSDDDV